MLITFGMPHHEISPCGIPCGIHVSIFVFPLNNNLAVGTNFANGKNFGD